MYMAYRLKLFEKYTLTNLKLAGIAVLMLFVCADLLALGLGNLDVQSNLNEPLRGEIELLTSSGDDIDSVKAKIAPRADFENLGINYSSYLGDINISVEQDGGSVVLRVNSADIVLKEPFVHMLIRVDWSGGSLLSEYTASILPPAQPPKVLELLTQPKLAGTDQSYDDDTVESFDIDAVDDSKAVNNDSKEQDKTEAVSDLGDGESRGENYASDPPTMAANEAYGSVVSGESLSLIAKDLQSQFPDLSIYQIMQVIFDENQNSFIRGNINGLIKGSILNIGDPNLMRALDDAKSRAFFREQRRKWDESLRVIGENDSIKSDQDEYSDSADSFTSDSIDDLAFSSSDPDSDNNFQVESSTTTDYIVSGARDDASVGEVVSLRKQVTELQTSSASGLIENQELTQRLLIIEKQLADMNRLMKLRKDTILTNEAAPLAAQNGADTEVASYASGKKLDDGSELTDSSSARTVVNSEIVDSSLAQAVTQGASVDLIIEPLTSVIEKTTEAANNKPALAEKALVASKTKNTPTRDEPNLVEKIRHFLFAVNSWKILAGIAAILVGSLVLLLMRRKRADKEFKIRMMWVESNTQSANDEQRPVATSITGPVTKTITGKNTELGESTSFFSAYIEKDAAVPADGDEFNFAASESIEIDLTDALDIDSIKFDPSSTLGESVNVRTLRERQELKDFEIDHNYDDARTQYELAKVVFDLGDEDGARNILNDIVKNNEGSDDVLADVNQLLASIP
ncbi:MAG: pilus assembly protein FimV [Gammaproteobacteria bacterium]